MNAGYLKNLRIIYLGLATGIIFFTIVCLLIWYSSGALLGNEISADIKAPLIIALITLTGFTFFAFRTIISGKISKLQEQHTLQEKLIAWRELTVFRGVLIEAPSFFAIVLFLLLGLHVLLLWPCAGIIFFWLTQPTREKLFEEARFSSSESSEFNKTDQNGYYQ